MTNDEIIRCFEKQADGTWLCVAAAAIATPEGAIEVAPGRRFAFGETMRGLDVAEYLEQLGVQFGS